MVRYCLDNNVSAAAREFSTTRKTVRKWRDRYLADGIEALEDQSRAPHSCPHKLSGKKEKKIIKIREQKPYLGPYRIIEEEGVKASYSAVHRVLKDAGLINSRKRKYKTKRDLREIKKKLKAFQKIQLDLKDLQDIPKYYPFLKNGFPRYQFSARDVRTGISFISYGYRKDSTNVAIFFYYLYLYLKKIGIDLTNSEFQTDNGNEFIGNYKAKNKKSSYQKLAEQLNLNTSLIPISSPTYNSDVEAFHSIIEKEFYDMEKYSSINNFLNKAFTYMLYFNNKRKFRYKEGKIPKDILINLTDSKKFAPNFYINFFPVILDNFSTYFNFSLPSSGYHVHISDKK